MMVYNVTVKVEPSIHEEWLRWMKEVHIPEVMGTGLFTGNRFMRLLDQDETDGMTYAIQYTCPGMEAYETYRERHAPALQEASRRRFGDRFVAFRTILKVV